MHRKFLLRLVHTLLASASLFTMFSPCADRLQAADASVDSLIQTAFETGTLSEGQRALETALAAHADPNDPIAARERYALAITQFLRSAEKLGQSWHRYGLNANAANAGLPFLRLPVGVTNPASTVSVSYEDFRAVFAAFLADVRTAELTFAALPDQPGAVSLRPGLVRIDYVGDGKPTSAETVWRTYARLNRAQHLTEQDAGQFLIKFDAGDVPWFRGYCHILSALAETVLAYDESRLFDYTAQIFFARPETPFPFLLAKPGGRQAGFELASISDLVAFIHLVNFPVREPARLTTALDHLTQVPALSRESWRRIQAETDNDHEWIPNPRQTGVLPGVEVTQEKIDAWLRTLAEADAILAGQKLLPFWRGQIDDSPRGVNLRRVFTEPTSFDLVLWVQGTQAAPYLESGRLTDLRLWREVSGSFGGNALGFALYFN